MRIYLAGPDVFHPDAIALGSAKKALCARYGVVGLYPLDAPLPPDASSAAIYAACLAMMREADAGIFNLTPFRGPSADVGTVFELGVMAAMGKPVFGYTNAADDMIDRLRISCDLTRDGVVWRDPDGLMAEDFGNADNLMIDETFRAQGRTLHRAGVPLERRFPDLTAFEACLAEALGR